MWRRTDLKKRWLAVRVRTAKNKSDFVIGLLLTACTENSEIKQSVFMPKKIIDLGALVTEELPEQVWGKRYQAC